MGCGASSSYKAPAPGAAEDDQDDPKLREYLKMRGLDPVDVQNQIQQKVGLSPAEARRRGQAAGATPGTVGDARSGFSNETKGGWKPKLPGQTEADSESDADESEDEDEDEDENEAQRSRRKGGRSKGGGGSRSKSSRGKGSSSRSSKSSSRDKFKKTGAAVLAKGEGGGRSKSRKKSSSANRGSSSSKRSSSSGGASGSSRRSSTKKGSSSSKKRSEKQDDGRDTNRTSSARGASGQVDDVEIDNDEDDARLANYMKISMGRRNALPPPPGDMMALLAAYK